MERRPFHPTNEIPKPSKLRQLVGETEQLSFQRAQFPQFLEKLQKEVSIGDLLQDRVAQAKLDVLLDAYSRDINAPKVTLKRKREGGGLGATIPLEFRGFYLNDEKYLYYFNTRQTEDSSKYVRDQDIVPPGEYKSWRREVTEPFKKSINRVSTDGGAAESYNYHSRQWEQNGRGIHTGIGTRNRRMPR